MSKEDQITARAAELAEWLLDAVSGADRDWRAIERRARELAEYAAWVAAGAAGPLGLSSNP
jgi:hypothetical protein